MSNIEIEDLSDMGMESDCSDCLGCTAMRLRDDAMFDLIDALDAQVGPDTLTKIESVARSLLIDARRAPGDVIERLLNQFFADKKSRATTRWHVGVIVDRVVRENVGAWPARKKEVA
jgi:hypothetical protein